MFSHIGTETELREEIAERLNYRQFSDDDIKRLFDFIAEHSASNDDLIEKLVTLLEISDDDYIWKSFDDVFSALKSNAIEVKSENHFKKWVKEMRAEFPHDVEFRYLSMIRNMDWLAYQLRDLWDWHTLFIGGKWYFYGN